MAFTKQQLDFLKKHLNLDKLKPLDKSTEEAAKAVFGESQATPLDPLREINDRMKQVAKMKFPTALDRQKADSLRQARGLVERGKLSEANKLLDALEAAAPKQGEKYAMKSMGEEYIRQEKNAPSDKMGVVNIGGSPRETRSTASTAGGHATSYMTPEQTKTSEVKVESSDAGTKLTQQGKAVTGENIYVMDGEGKIMAQDWQPFEGNSDKGKVMAMDSQGRPIAPHHSNFLRGEDVAGAGELHTDDDGILKKVTDKSGHYKPDAVHTQQVLESLEEQGANLNNVKFKAGRTNTEGMAKEFQQGGDHEQFEQRHKVVDEIKKKSHEIKKKSGLLED